MNATSTDTYPSMSLETTYSSSLYENSTADPDLRKQTPAYWITITSYITVPLLFAVGLVGNILTIIAMRSRRFQQSSTGVYLTALALSDMTFILVFPFSKSTANQLLNMDVKAISSLGCKVFFLIFRGTKISSSWFVILIGIERFLVVWFPLKARIISNKRISLISASCVAVAIFTFEGVRTSYTNIINGMCMPYYAEPETIELQSALIIGSTVIYSVIPTAILLAATPLTIIKLFLQQKKRRQMTHTTTNDETVRVTIMLLSVTVAYVVLVTPIAVAHSAAFFQGDNIYLSRDPSIIIFREVAQILEQMNYVVNFFLYVVSNATFRRQVFQIFTCQSQEQIIRATQKPESRAPVSNIGSSSAADDVSGSQSTLETYETQSM